MDAPEVYNLPSSPVAPSKTVGRAWRSMAAAGVAMAVAAVASARRMSYYDVPLLKRPVWKWYIPAYFFLGGVAGASSTLGRCLRRCVGDVLGCRWWPCRSARRA